MGSNRSGIIQNKSGDQIVYTLHSKGLFPTQNIVNKTHDSQFNLRTEGGISADFKGWAKSESETKEAWGSRDSIYVVPPYQIKRDGLVNVDFSVTNYLSIFNVKKRAYLIQNSKISSPQHIRVRINKDGTINMIHQKDMYLMEKFADAQTLKRGVCGMCGSPSIAKQVEQACDLCRTTKSAIWYCNAGDPHMLCLECQEGCQLRAAIERLN